MRSIETLEPHRSVVVAPVVIEENAGFIGMKWVDNWIGHVSVVFVERDQHHSDHAKDVVAVNWKISAKGRDISLALTWPR